jgi:hypothetical protein
MNHLNINEKQLPDLFNNPIKSKKVRNGVTAYAYSNGVININGQKYIGYSLTEAIKKYRKTFPYMGETVQHV